MSPHCYADDVSSEYRRAFDKFGISATHFVRTTSPEHRDTVTRLWSKISRAGHIYKASHQGWYCVPDETFVADRMVATSPKDGVTKARIMTVVFINLVIFLSNIYRQSLKFFEFRAFSLNIL